MKCRVGMKKAVLLITASLALANASQYNIKSDSLKNELWLEAEKAESIKICLDTPVREWKTSLSTVELNDSCLAFQAPTLIGVETLNVYFPDSDSSHKINLAVGMRYLDFRNEEVLLGYDEFTKKQMIFLFMCKNFDPERLVSVSATYLVDKYPVTNCEFTQLMWDSIPEKGTYNKDLSIEKARKKWLSRKKTSIRHENCIAHDTAANTIPLYQAMKYANARSMREGLKPYYIFSVISDNEGVTEEILSNGYIVGYWDFSYHDEYYVQVIIDSTSDGYRLPYLDEWSMFARGGDKKNKAPWGDSSATQEESMKYAKYGPKEEYYYTEPVGQLLPNGYGLYDMFGLVWERVLLKKYLCFNFEHPTILKGCGYDCNRFSNYGSFETGDDGVFSGFRLIRNIGNNVKWSEVKTDEE